MSKKLLSTFLVGTVLAIAAPAQAATTDVWAGANVAHNSWFAYVGGATALQGQDILTQPGFLARLSGGYGQYSYGRTGLSDVDGDVGQADLMLGYGVPFAGGHASAYVGGDWIDQKLSPNDPNNSAHGSEGGLKLQLEATDLKPMDHIVANGLANYSTAFRSYWSHFDVGYSFGNFSLGPEIGFMGNKEYNEVRYGGKVGDIDVGFADTSLHVGYVASNRNGSDGAYGEIGFNKNF